MFEANLMTTAMGILPHTDVGRALELALSLDIAFWPQLPRLHFGEDMYVQASHGFPGIVVDYESEKILFDTARFYDELLAYAEASLDPDYFALTPEHSRVYHRFLARDLSGYAAIHGQTIGPISFGLKIADENLKPIIYDAEVKTILFEFLQKKINRQTEELRARNANAFVWIDDPGLEFIFSSLSGYTDVVASEDMGDFLAGLDGPKGVHLCGNPDWDFLLGADLGILSFDTYSRGTVFVRYADQIGRFLRRGGLISWGIVPTGVEDFSVETVEALIGKLEGFWDHLREKGVGRETIVRQGLLAPATCCLLNPDGTGTVERAFDVLRAVSAALRQKYGVV